MSFWCVFVPVALIVVRVRWVWYRAEMIELLATTCVRSAIIDDSDASLFLRSVVCFDRRYLWLLDGDVVKVSWLVLRFTLVLSTWVYIIII